MAETGFFYETEGDEQFIISQELICLLKWLVENEGGHIKRAIKKSLSSGLNNRLKKVEHNEQFNLEDAQQSIIDFFCMLEQTMLDSLNEQAVKHAVEKNLIPAIEHIDSTICDDAMIRFSIERASTKGKKSKESPQELFFKEILKRWKPRKKNILN